MTRLVEASHWVFFDVLACDAASGARLAMALRDQLPGAFVRSEPARSPSCDERRPHLLHCRAALAGASAAQTQMALSAALGALDALAPRGAHVPAVVVFCDGERARTARAA